MPRRSLKPELNKIRAWVHQGRTDAWIAHQLEISASELREFRKQYDLSSDDENAGSSEIDLRDEIEAEIEAAAAEQEQAEEAEAAESDDDEDESEDGDEDGEGTGSARPKRRRRRGRRGGRGRRKEIEATFDHGETDGYGLWLDASVKDNPVYAEHWAGKSDVTVRIEADQIVIRRAGSPAPGEESDSDSDDELAAAGEVGRAPQVQPEGGVGERLGVALE
ncbi:MAG TPA: hypothetical protein VLL27_04945 [Solirubrobacterales bacterium]|nr:hypothetical protein [Solirubrobacterales bacterium]